MKTRASILNLLFATFIISLAGCTKEVERGFPRVKTIKPLYINESEVILRGEITNYKSVDFQEYGFIFSDSVFGEDHNLMVINLGTKPGSEQFESVFPEVIEPGTAYYYAAYAIANDILSLGSEESLESYNCFPEITGLSSTEVSIGSDLIIYGNNFSPVASQNTVRIGSIEITPESATATQLTINIDPGFSAGSYIISVKTCGEYVSFNNEILITNQWEKVADFPGGEVYKTASFVLNGYGYVGTGTGLNHNYLTSFFKYNPINNSWSTIQSFPGHTRIWANAFSINGNGFVGGGFDMDAPTRESLKDYYSYNETEGWKRISDFPYYSDKNYNWWQATVDNTRYFSPYVNGLSTFKPDPEQWTQDDNAPTIIQGASSFVINGLIYIIDYNKSVFEYNPSTGLWIQKNDFPGTGRYFGVGYSYDGHGYYGLGTSGLLYLKDIWEYNPSNDTWIESAPFTGQGRDLAFCFVIGDYVYIGTGYIGGNRCTRDVYRKKLSPDN